MLALGIRYLTGCVVASDVANRNQPEWPPHPGRIFMALAAAHFNTGSDAAERTALEWLETLPAPEIHAPARGRRSIVTHYVPVNDKAGPSKAPIQSANGLTRERQPRTFARAWLDDDTVYLVWPKAEPNGHFQALANVCEKVTRIGHSTCLVQMWASQNSPDRTTNWLPDEKRATERFRIATGGLLHRLEHQFNQHAVEEFFDLREVAEDKSNKDRQKAARTTLKEKYSNLPPIQLRPEISTFQGYTFRGTDEQTKACGTVFDRRLLVFSLQRVDSPYRWLDLTATLQITGGFRDALLHHLGKDSSELLTGHRGEGPAQRPHLAFLPLSFVSHEHAHGGVLGVAVALPRNLEMSERQRLLVALAGIRKEGLKLGPLGKWELEPADSASPFNLRERTWTAAPNGARQWATVTPYVYDRHPKAKDKSSYIQELAEAIQSSWARISEAENAAISVNVAVTPVSGHLGAPLSHRFPRLVRKDGSQCRHTHAILIFDRPVVGPVLLGVGRYRGYGLCRPL